MTIIFTVSYGLRAIYSIIQGINYYIVPVYFTRQMIEKFMDVVQDFPPIISMVYLNMRAARLNPLEDS